jgi:hypothetical protein
MEGSSISGWWFEDQVRLGDNFSHNPAVRSKMGCHSNENKLFYDQKANGIFGIGPSHRTLLQDLFGDTGHVDSSIFTLCFADWGGRLVVGGANDSYHTGAVQYMPMTTSSGQYIVPLSSMHIDGQEVSRTFGTTFIDSGTTYTYMATAAYRTMRGAIERYCSRHAGCGAIQTGKCWTVSIGLYPDAFPNVSMTFGASVQMTWTARSYMYQRGSTPEWCYAFEDDGPGAGTTLGASWMIHQDVIFDMKTMQVGIAPANCPEFRCRKTAEGGPCEITNTVMGSASTELASAISRLRTRHQAIWWAAAAALLSMSFLICALSHDLRLCPGQSPVSDPQHMRLEAAAAEIEMAPQERHRLR